MSSHEGQDGKISIKIIDSAEDLSSSIQTEIMANGEGYGVKAAASIGVSHSSSISSNQVILKASHSIDLGKAFTDPSSFILSKSASRLLATDYKGFI